MNVEIEDIGHKPYHSDTEKSILSIAISLKRIADKLELSQKQPIIMTADEALKFYAVKDGC